MVLNFQYLHNVFVNQITKFGFWVTQLLYLMLIFDKVREEKNLFCDLKKKNVNIGSTNL